MARIRGAKEHREFLKRLASPEFSDGIGKLLYAAGQEIELDAERSITEGSVSGKSHVPSLPGEPPNADTRTLDTNIETYVVPAMQPTVHVESKAPYSGYLEWGTSKMAERPFMRPAVNRNRKKIQDFFNEGIAVLVRRMQR